MTTNETEDWFEKPIDSKPQNNAFSKTWENYKAAIKSGLILSLKASLFHIISNYLFHKTALRLDFWGEVQSILLVLTAFIFYYVTIGAALISFINFLCKKITKTLSKNRDIIENIMAGILNLIFTMLFFQFLKLMGIIGNSFLGISIIMSFMFGIFGNILFNKFIKEKS